MPGTVVTFCGDEVEAIERELHPEARIAKATLIETVKLRSDVMFRIKKCVNPSTQLFLTRRLCRRAAEQGGSVSIGAPVRGLMPMVNTNVALRAQKPRLDHRIT
jgi:hypothetical protein